MTKEVIGITPASGKLVGFSVVKRNGEVVDFDEDKITQAIKKAVRATQETLEDKKVDLIVNNICTEVEERFVDFYPNVENIQDVVEKHLVKEGLYNIAKHYILYRAQRQKERDEEKQHNVEKAQLGKLKVIKRDGRTVLFDHNRMRNYIKNITKGYENDVSADLISKQVIRNLFDGISADEIEKAMILATSSFIERDPAYSIVASRMFQQKLFREITGQKPNDPNREKIYRDSLQIAIKRGVEAEIYDERMLEYDFEKISQNLLLDRDSMLQYMGIQTLHERYFVKVNKDMVELPQVFWMRVAMGLALNEPNREEKAIEFYETLSSLRFVSSSPTLFHSGLKHSQLSSCYLSTVKDDLDHIFKVYRDNAFLSKWAGGIGNDWSYIRSTGAMIKTAKITSQGLIPFLKIANDVVAAISRSGRKRGATCAYLETWHLDIEEFLDLRKNTGDDRRRTHDMNTANWIPDLFFKRVLNDEPWTLFSPDETPDLHDLYGRKFEKRYLEYEKMAQNGEIHKHKTVSAVKLWRKMISMLYETGHPWMTFKDPCNIRSPQDHCGVVHSSNLCTEITLNTSPEETAVCNLGSINLQRHIINGKLDEDLIAKTVQSAVRMLDNVIDLNFYPTQEAKFSNLKHRPIGMGIMGFQDALFLQDIDFESQDAITFADKSMEMISYYAILTSSQLAKEKGKYESYEGSKWSRNIFPVDTLDILEEERGIKIPTSREESMDWTPVRMHVKEHGMRNSNVMAMAPTATISNIAGCFPTIEAIYKNIYVKANISGEFTVVNHYLVKDLKELKMWNQEMLDQIKYYDGNIAMIAGIPDKLKKKYKEVFEIDTEIYLKIAAARSKWIDQSQSLNVFIKGTSGKKLNDTYLYAWKLGLKTTYYLRTLAASQIEKSTLDASKFGFTQKRETESKAPEQIAKPATEVGGVKLCKIEDPECTACE